MVTKIRFTEPVNQYLKSTGTAKTVRSRLFRMSNKSDQMAYQEILNNFKKWIFYSKPVSFDNAKLVELFFDFDHMITEYSMHYGIKSGEEMIQSGELKNRSNSMIKSLESIIEESLKNLERNIEETVDPKYGNFIHDIEHNWEKSFIINCVPNILNGNYVNIPMELVQETTTSDPVSFNDNETYFFSFLNRLPLKFNRITIGDTSYYNIVNTTIVPLFITLERDYVLVKE